jgi:hypothetical protein
MTDFSSNCFVCKDATTFATNCCDKLMCSNCYHKRNQCPDCNSRKQFNERLVAKAHFIDGKYYCACGAIGHQRSWNSHFKTHDPYSLIRQFEVLPNHRWNTSQASQLPNNAVAIGYTAGQTSQHPNNAVAIGYTAGQASQLPNNAVAIGSTAGQTTQQPNNTVAIRSTTGQRYQIPIRWLSGMGVGIGGRYSS